MKSCKRCGEEKELDKFNVRNARWVDNVCKSCHHKRCSELRRARKQKAGFNVYRGSTDAWQRNNPEKVKGYQKKYSVANPGKRRHKENMRKLAKIQAVPSWLTADQKLAIKEFYKNRPAGFHVDHIIPLRGKEVRGLHVPWNLQYLPALENIKKNNKVVR